MSNIFDLQPHEQKKEGERFFYEVCDIVSTLPFTWLIHPLSLKTMALPTYSHLRARIRQTVEHELCPCLFLLPQSFLSQTNEHVGNEGWRWCQEGVSLLASSHHHHHPLCQNIPRVVRMWGYFWLRFYLYRSLLW